MSGSQTLIAVESLSKHFGLRPALRAVTFSLPRGGTVALLGPNGGGKTTLLRILAALSRQTAGTAHIGGWELPREAAAVRAQIGYVGHQPLLYAELSAAENLAFYARLYGLPQPEAAIGAALERVGLAARAAERVGGFSRGMQQRLAIARAALHQPAVMLLDEPFTGLDAAGSAMLDGLIGAWRDEGRTTLLAMHDIAHAACLCQRALILRRGALVADVATAETPDLPALFHELTAA